MNLYNYENGKNRSQLVHSQISEALLMFRSKSFTLWLWHIDHEWTIWERNELIVVEPWQYPNWRSSWWVCDKAMQMVLWHRNCYDRRETAKFARNQLVCMSFLVGFVLFEGINHHWKNASTWFDGLSTQGTIFAALPHELLVQDWSLIWSIYIIPVWPKHLHSCSLSKKDSPIKLLKLAASRENFRLLCDFGTHEDISAKTGRPM